MTTVLDYLYEFWVNQFWENKSEEWFDWLLTLALKEVSMMAHLLLGLIPRNQIQFRAVVEFKNVDWTKNHWMKAYMHGKHFQLTPDYIGRKCWLK